MEEREARLECRQRTKGSEDKGREGRSLPKGAPTQTPYTEGSTFWRTLAYALCPLKSLAQGSVLKLKALGSVLLCVRACPLSVRQP